MSEPMAFDDSSKVAKIAIFGSATMEGVHTWLEKLEHNMDTIIDGVGTGTMGPADPKDTEARNSMRICAESVRILIPVLRGHIERGDMPNAVRLAFMLGTMEQQIPIAYDAPFTKIGRSAKQGESGSRIVRSEKKTLRHTLIRTAFTIACANKGPRQSPSQLINKLSEDLVKKIESDEDLLKQYGTKSGKVKGFSPTSIRATIRGLPEFSDLNILK